MDPILAILSDRLGIRIREREIERLLHQLQARAERLGFSDLHAYGRFLHGPPLTNQAEWEELATQLTTGETFFFRDQGQINLLRHDILPELVERRRTAGSLRIWSAGCSSGEEAYTIAMLLQPPLIDPQQWKVTILGTDVNPKAIAKARRGVFTDWSMRSIPAEFQRRYFRATPDGWTLDRELRQPVHFEHVNLLSRNDPRLSARQFDLIVCRNVFIYFDDRHIEAVLDHFRACLSPGGYLITGHGELQGVAIDPLERVRFRDQVVHQMPSEPSRERPGYKHPAPPRLATAAESSGGGATKDPSNAADGAEKEPALQKHASTESPAALHGAAEPLEESLEHVEQLLHMGRNQAAIDAADEALRAHSQSIPLLVLLARGLANVGQLAAAQDRCHQALEIDSFAVAPHCLLARLAEDAGRYDEAKRHLRRVIYLEPTHLEAFLELGDLHQREGDAAQARKYRRAAVELLSLLPKDQLLPLPGAPTVRQLSDYLQQRVTHG